MQLASNFLFRYQLCEFPVIFVCIWVLKMSKNHHERILIRTIALHTLIVKINTQKVVSIESSQDVINTQFLMNSVNPYIPTQTTEEDESGHLQSPG